MQKNDPQNYRNMAIPFPSPDETNDALEAFYEAVGEARKKFKITDVHVICKFSFTSGEREIGGLSSAHFGNELEATNMCAWGLGQERVSREAMIAEYLAHNNSIMDLP
ncbi:MAG: hypothetical protein U9N61_08890 [Euryarchaeota archaeon]|nr:hypothetical protein [Euryarchaeota archaeon]